MVIDRQPIALYRSHITSSSTPILIETADFIRDRREELVTIWEKEVRIHVDSAEGTQRVSLRNHLVELLEDLQEGLRQVDRETTAREAAADAFQTKWSKNHGLSRARAGGYNTLDVLKEYIFLRRVVTDQLVRYKLNDAKCIESLNSMFELAFMGAVRAFTEAESRSQEMVVNSLVHDIKLPVSNALFGLSILGENPSNSDIFAEMHPRIEKSCRRALHMISNLMETIPKSEGNALSFNFEQIDLAVKLRKQAEELMNIYGQNFQMVATPAQLEGVFESDMILRVIDNLVSAAFRRSFGESAVILKVRDHNESIVISIRDQGDSISAEDQEKILKILNTSKAANSSPFEGKEWGTDFTFVQRLVSAHGGKVSFSSAQETGTEFVLTLGKQYEEPGIKRVIY